MIIVMTCHYVDQWFYYLLIFFNSICRLDFKNWWRTSGYGALSINRNEIWSNNDVSSICGGHWCLFLDTWKQKVADYCAISCS